MPWSRPTRRTTTRGKKGIVHPDPADPPRRRANHRRGHGTFANDRPPVVGVVGRESGEIRLEVIESASGAELEATIDDTCLEGTTINTDEWEGYSRVGEQRRRTHVTADHSGPKGTWALDLDGDGVREVHCNTQEGLWTGLRIFLGRFPGREQVVSGAAHPGFRGATRRPITASSTALPRLRMLCTSSKKPK